MQALILAGGKGLRLRPLTIHTPKPIVPVANRPFLHYQIELLKRAGITDITLSLSYQPNKIEELFGDGSEHGVKIRYTVEAEPLGTAGAFKHALADSRAARARERDRKNSGKDAAANPGDEGRGEGESSGGE